LENVIGSFLFTPVIALKGGIIIKYNLISPNVRAYFLLTFTAICWGMNVIFGQLAVGQASPMAVVTFRWLGVLLLLGIFSRNYLLQDWPILRRRIPYIFFMGALGYTCFNSVFYLAAYTTSAINVGILQGSIPVFIVLGSYFFRHTNVSGIQIFGILATICGVCVVGSGGNLLNLTELVFKFGDILMIIACFLYAGYTIGLERRPKSSALGIFTLMAVFAFIASLPLLGIEIFLGMFQWPTRDGWVIIGLITLFPSFLAQILFMHGVEIIGPARAGIFANLVPVFGSVLAVFILDETFAIFQGVALVLVLGGIWLSERAKNKGSISR